MNQNGGELDLFLQPLTSIHLRGALKFEMETNVDVRFIYFLIMIAILILLIACFNFINLYSAQSMKRSKEVALRKVIGSNRWQLIKQFFGESLTYVLIALMLSLFLVKISLPAFNSFITRDIEFNIFIDQGIPLILLGIVIFTGLVSGCYPALILSSFQPIRIIRGTFKFGSKGKEIFRNVLVIVQFAIVISLITSSYIIFNQLNFLREKSFGTSDDPIVNIYLADRRLKSHPEPFISELKQNPQIIDLTTSLNLPISIQTGNSAHWDGQTEDEQFYIRQTYVDYGFIDFYNLEILKGRNFRKEITTDKEQAVLINETAARKIGWDNPIGKRLKYGDEDVIVIGVVKDFHHQPLYTEIEPLAIGFIREKGFFAGVNYVSVKLRPENIQGTLAFLEKTWKKFSPGYPFNFAFLDESIQVRYQTEIKMGHGITSMAYIAILLSCMGVFGLSLYSIEEKKKEVGIRRVLGASAREIIIMISKRFILAVFLSFLVSLPATLYINMKWLQKFAYRTNIGIAPFVFSAALTLIITLLTISYQTIKAATANPVDSLWNE